MSAVAIFVKTPGVSPVKTRLAETIGSGRACELYRYCAAAVAEVARSAVDTVYWAVAEPADRIAGQWPESELIEQGSGDLGERMHRVLATLIERHGSGLLLGADAPQLEPDIIERAACHLKNDAPTRVIGPARDGGFWIFGANRTPPLERWTHVEYSRADTLQSFRQSIGDDDSWLELPMLTDLDTADDIPRVAAEMAALTSPLSQQTRLLELLQKSKHG